MRAEILPAAVAMSASVQEFWVLPGKVTPCASATFTLLSRMAEQLTSTPIIRSAHSLLLGGSKDNIKPIDKASEAVLALKPVSFRYKKEIDASGTAQFGLIAEEVAEINSDLVTRDSEGKPETVRCEAVNAMLLNEFLKEHRKNAEQGVTITALKSTDAKQEAIITQLKFLDARQEATIARQQQQIDALTAGLQKVSAQLEVSKAASQTVVNNQ